DLLAGEVAARGASRLIDIRRQAEKMLHHSYVADRPENYRLALRWLAHTSLREQGAVRSAARLAATPESARRVATLVSRIGETERSETEALRELYRSLTGSAPPEPALSAGEQKAAGLVPVLRREFFHHQWDRFLHRDSLPADERAWLESYQKRLP